MKTCGIPYENAWCNEVRNLPNLPIDCGVAALRHHRIIDKLNLTWNTMSRVSAEAYRQQYAMIEWTYAILQF